MRKALCLYQPEMFLGKVQVKEQTEQVTGNLFESGSRRAESFAGDGGSCVYLGNFLPFAAFHEGMGCSGA